MSSPNLCGNVALLLSALKADGVLFSKHRIHRALRNTAAAVDGGHPRAQGCGLVQVHTALEYLYKWAHLGPLEDINFKVTVSGRRADAAVLCALQYCS